jgi:phosphatidylinositol alpha-1,6-mannosyltransferase
VNEEKIRVITIGIQDTYGEPKPDRATVQRDIGVNVHDRLLLLTTGRLVKRKGVAWFISHVLPAIADKYPNVLYVVAGEGEQRRAIEDAVQKMKLDGNVKLLGLVSDELRRALYLSSDVFVMPNIQVDGDMEGFGIVALEAATAGLPIVASNLEGIRDAIKDGQNGTLVESADSDGFIREVSQLLASKGTREMSGTKACRYTLKHYSWPHVAGAYGAVYDTLIKK